MPRLRGYAKVGERCFDNNHDWHAKGRINAIAAIIDFVFVTLSLVEGSINSDIFYAWLTKALLPKLPIGAVIVMDNASFHKRADILATIEQRGFILELLPSYSPDLNPIESKWAQAKDIRRQHRCDVDTLFRDHFPYVSL